MWDKAFSPFNTASFKGSVLCEEQTVIYWCRSMHLWYSDFIRSCKVLAVGRARGMSQFRQEIYASHISFHSL